MLEKAASTKGDDEDEDDWSAIMTGDLAGGTFAHHEIQEIRLPSGCSGKKSLLKIASTASLSPLDMMDLSWGACDATGHRIWLGAKLWICALPKIAPFFSSSSQQQTCRCLELGSGTGLAGLAVLHYISPGVSLDMVLTDNSTSALELCQANCERNKLPNDSESKIRVEPLEWGRTLINGEAIFDVIIATDVIYDLASWVPLLETARGSLRVGGYILLAHVPRAALKEDEFQGDATLPYQQKLESYLTTIAAQYSFLVLLHLRPNELDTFEGQDDMEGADASIFVFERQNEASEGNSKACY